MLVQALLRLKGFDARINGIADARLFEVVNAYRISRGFHTFGAVDGHHRIVDAIEHAAFGVAHHIFVHHIGFIVGHQGVEHNFAGVVEVFNA